MTETVTVAQLTFPRELAYAHLNPLCTHHFRILHKLSQQLLVVVASNHVSLRTQMRFLGAVRVIFPKWQLTMYTGFYVAALQA